MSPEHESNDHHHKPDAFTGAHETSEDLMWQIAKINGLDVEAQSQPATDEPELVAHIRQARMELTHESEDTVILWMAREMAGELSDQKLADDVYVSLAQAYGKRGDISGATEAVNQIHDHVSRLEGLVRLAKITGEGSIKEQLAEAAENKAGHVVDIDIAREVFYKFRTEEGDLNKANNFSELVTKSALNASNYPKAVDTEARVALMSKIEPRPPKPSLQAQAEALAAEARHTTGLSYLDQYYTKAQAEQPGPEKDKMLAAYMVATIELANDSRQHDQIAA